MCRNCWLEYGAPRVVNKKTLAARDLIAAVYEGHAAGGNAHIVIDDWNLEDEHVHYCRGCSDASQDDEEQCDAETACLGALLKLTEDERASALAMYDDFFDPEKA